MPISGDTKAPAFSYLNTSRLGAMRLGYYASNIFCSFAHLLPDRVIHEARTGTDAYGDPSYGRATSYRARVVGEQKSIRGFSGAEVMAVQTVYLGVALIVQPLDRITLSTAIVASTQASAIQPPILGAKRIPDQSGTHHAVVYLG